MIILAQRWVERISGGEEFGRPVVEALVIARDAPCDQINCTLYSAFYDPNQGQTLATAFKWWNRGRAGMLPHLCSLAMDVLSHWSMPADQATSFKDFVDRLEEMTEQTREAFKQAHEQGVMR